MSIVWTCIDPLFYWLMRRSQRENNGRFMAIPKTNLEFKIRLGIVRYQMKYVIDNFVTIATSRVITQK